MEDDHAVALPLGVATRAQRDRRVQSHPPALRPDDLGCSHQRRRASRACSVTLPSRAREKECKARAAARPITLLAVARLRSGARLALCRTRPDTLQCDNLCKRGSMRKRKAWSL